MDAPTTDPNLLNRPGDIVIESVNLLIPSAAAGKPEEISLKDFIYSVEIYEDIFSNSLSGSIVFGDALALKNHYIIMGNESIRITFYTPGQENQQQNKIELVFRVYKSHSTEASDKAKITTIEFVSEEFFFNTTTKFSTAYKQKSYSDMASQIFDQHIWKAKQNDKNYLNKTAKFWVPVPSEGTNKSVVFPWWSPFYAINWLANKSFSSIKENKCADYLFFQHLNGTYVFAPLSYFKGLPKTATYRQIPTDKQRDKTMFDNITELTVISSNDKMQDVATGVYGSILNTFDIHNKKMEGSIFDYYKEFSSSQHINKHPLVSPNTHLYGNPLAYKKILPKNSNRFSGIPDNEEHEKYALLRQSSMNQMNCITLQLKVAGDSRRRVGDIVELKITSPEDISKKTQQNEDFGMDRYLSGLYMITKINHSFFHQDYDLILTVTKDSYGSPITEKTT